RLTAVFFFLHTTTTDIYTLSLHDALPICEAQPIGVGVGFRYAGVAMEQQPGRRVGVHRGNLSRFEGRQREVCAAPGHVVLRQRRSEEHTSELQSLAYLVCRLLLEKKKKKK